MFEYHCTCRSIHCHGVWVLAFTRIQDLGIVQSMFEERRVFMHLD